MLYVDNCLAISDNPEHSLGRIVKYFNLKPGSIGPPKIYLGGKVGTIMLPNGVRAYTFSYCQYVRQAVIQVEEYMMKNKVRFTNKKIGTPLPTNYSPELDGWTELGDEQANYYSF